MQKDMELEKEYLEDTLELINLKLNELKLSSNHLEGIFDESNKEYFDYLKSNAKKSRPALFQLTAEKGCGTIGIAKPTEYEKQTM